MVICDYIISNLLFIALSIYDTCTFLNCINFSLILKIINNRQIFTNLLTKKNYKIITQTLCNNLTFRLYLFFNKCATVKYIHIPFLD